MSPVMETVERIEPAPLEDLSEAISDVVAELSAAAAKLGHALNPQTAANLAGLVRIMNTYYSNLIEGHNTRPRDIARAIDGNFDNDEVLAEPADRGCRPCARAVRNRFNGARKSPA